MQYAAAAAGAPAAAHAADRRRPAGSDRLALRVVAVLLILLGAHPLNSALHAQTTLGGEAVVLGANVLVGGLTSGLVALVRGESFVDALDAGIAGGSLQYAGKRLTTLRWSGAGLAGRMIGATGASMIQNGAAGRGMLDLLVFPAGPIPVTLYLTTVRDSVRLVPRLHVGRTIFLARLIMEDDLRLDWSATLSAGTPVFDAPGRIIEGFTGGSLGGVELWGTVAMSDVGLLPPIDGRRILAHERVHIIQDDFLNIAWADPLEDLVIAELPAGDAINRYVDIGLMYMGIAGVLFMIFPYEDRPWEIEAHYMEDGL